MELPSLVYDYRDALIDAISLGPRQEVTLTIVPLDWVGTKGMYGTAVRLRFGGINNFAEVQKFFAEWPEGSSELTFLRYATAVASKPGALVFELAFERNDLHLMILCSSLQVSD